MYLCLTSVLWVFRYHTPSSTALLLVTNNREIVTIFTATTNLFHVLQKYPLINISYSSKIYYDIPFQGFRMSSVSLTPHNFTLLSYLLFLVIDCLVIWLFSTLQQHQRHTKFRQNRTKVLKVKARVTRGRKKTTHIIMIS